MRDHARERQPATDEKRGPREEVDNSSAEPGPGSSQPTGPPFLQHLAAIAPGLTEAELRVLIELAQRAEPPEFAGKVSQRVLAISTGCGRESVRRAIEGLVRDKHITVRPGATTRDAGTPFECNFLRTVPITSGLTMSPLEQKNSTAMDSPEGLTMRPVAEISTAPASASGLTMSPLPTENQQLTLAAELPRARVGSIKSFDSISIDREQEISTKPTPEEAQLAILDRVLSARPRDFSEAQHAQARTSIMGHVAKFPARLGEYNNAPDRIVTAQLLTVAEWPTLADFFLQLRIDRTQAGEKYVWFVAVALERIHGIRPEALKQKRDERRQLQQLPKLLAAAKRMP